MHVYFWHITEPQNTKYRNMYTLYITKIIITKKKPRQGDQDSDMKKTWNYKSITKILSQNTVNDPTYLSILEAQCELKPKHVIFFNVEISDALKFQLRILYSAKKNWKYMPFYIAFLFKFSSFIWYQLYFN